MGKYKFSAPTTAFYPVEMLDSYEQAGTLLAGKIRGSKGKKPDWVDIPPPTPDELRQDATTRKARLQDEAEQAIRQLERAVRLDMATNEEETRLEDWERYSVLLSRVDVDNPEWPDKPK